MPSLFALSSMEKASNASSDSAVTRRPTLRQPPHAATMNVGEVWKQSFEEIRLEVEYTRLSPAEAAHQLSIRDTRPRTSQELYGTEGSGKYCPRCGKNFVIIAKVKDWADDMRADQEGIWVCEDIECGMQKREEYHGYGSIFNDLQWDGHP